MGRVIMQGTSAVLIINLVGEYAVIGITNIFSSVSAFHTAFPMRDVFHNKKYKEQKGIVQDPVGGSTAGPHGDEKIFGWTLRLSLPDPTVACFLSLLECIVFLSLTVVLLLSHLL